MGCAHSSFDVESHASFPSDSSSSDLEDERIGILPYVAAIGDSTDSDSEHVISHELTQATGNQSMDDDCSRESVVDWLATTKSTQSSYLMKSDMICFFRPLLKKSKETIKSGTFNDRVTKTSIVERRHVALPTTTPDGMTNGDFLKHRYIVNDYILMQKLGKGAHSEVRLSKNKTSNELFAVKIIHKGRHQVLQQEISILTTLSHENVIRLYEVIDDQRVDKVYLVLEYLQRGDLMTIVQNEGPFSNDDAHLRNIVTQIMCGLSYLHKSNILQNDLKPSNVLLSKDGTVKIADFGISMTCRIRRSDDHSGTPAYMAPEELEESFFDGRMADVFSLGGTCFFLRFGRPPFIGRNITDLYHQIKSAKLCFPCDENKSTALQDFISRLMEKDPLLRLCLKDAFKHRWLVGGKTSGCSNHMPHDCFHACCHC